MENLNMPPPEPKWSWHLDGTHFYKYGSGIGWLEPVLLRTEIYFPRVAELNDPRDSRPRIAGCRQRKSRSS
jgi:hypothetical protein